MSAFDSTFRAAIPGASLAHKMGSLPHEKPPQYVDPNEALEYFWKQLNRKDILKQIWNLLEQGATVWSITRAILYKAAVSGIIQLNLAVVIYPIVGKMIHTIGAAKNIKNMKTYPKFRDKIKDDMLNKKLNEAMGKQGNNPIPPSALKGMVIPKAEDITHDHTKFMQMKMPIGASTSEVAPKTGLLNKIGE